MAGHDLKTWPEPFSAIYDGDKTFEVRKDDRGFSRFDTLRLYEYFPLEKRYSGRYVDATVTYILRDSFGVKKNHVVMALAVESHGVDYDKATVAADEESD